MRIRIVPLVLFVLGFVAIIGYLYPPTLVQPGFVNNYALEHFLFVSLSLWFIPSAFIKISATMNQIQLCAGALAVGLFMATLVLFVCDRQVNISPILRFHWYNWLPYGCFWLWGGYDINYTVGVVRKYRKVFRIKRMRKELYGKRN